MGIIKKRRIMNKNREDGKDSENTEYYKEYIKHNLNPFSDNVVSRHEKTNDPYDWKRKNVHTGRTTYVENKLNNAKLSEREKEFKENHPRSYEVNHKEGGSFINDARKTGRKIKEEWDNL